MSKPLVSDDLWAAMAPLLPPALGLAKRGGRSGAIAAPAPLTGKLRDETGDRLTPTHGVKAGRRIRY